MNKYIKYLHYVIRHKWFVMLECFREGLIIRGLFHDNSKFRPDEFIPYANFFYGYKPPKGSTGFFKSTEIGNARFDWAWLLHQKRNDHHWQYFLLPEDNGGTKVLEMSSKARLEMVCDWVGAGKAQGHFPEGDRFSETRKWYEKNGSKMTLHPETRRWIEEKINYKSTV
jgi:hypothetical protein